jgi:hypothetical protein
VSEKDPLINPITTNSFLIINDFNNHQDKADAQNSPLSKDASHPKPFNIFHRDRPVTDLSEDHRSSLIKVNVTPKKEIAIKKHKPEKSD